MLLTSPRLTVSTELISLFNNKPSMFSLLFILRKILIYSRINDTLKRQKIHTKKEKIPRTTSSKEGGKMTKRPHSMKAKTKS